jgi:hypothetical protein
MIRNRHIPAMKSRDVCFVDTPQSLWAWDNPGWQTASKEKMNRVVGFVFIVEYIKTFLSFISAKNFKTFSVL